jgi:hypothetical protein
VITDATLRTKLSGKEVLIRRLEAELRLTEEERQRLDLEVVQVRETPRRPRSWAKSSPL